MTKKMTQQEELTQQQEIMSAIQQLERMHSIHICGHMGDEDDDDENWICEHTVGYYDEEMKRPIVIIGRGDSIAKAILAAAEGEG